MVFIGLMEENGASEEPEPLTKEIAFKYVKSNLFRVIHADGAWGGIAPRGYIHMALYSERQAIPTHSAIPFSEDGPIGKEKFERDSSFVREVEADVVLDLATAINLRDWLSDRIGTMNELIREAKKEQADDPATTIPQS